MAATATLEAPVMAIPTASQTVTVTVHLQMATQVAAVMAEQEASAVQEVTRCLT